MRRAFRLVVMIFIILAISIGGYSLFKHWQKDYTINSNEVYLPLEKNLTIEQIGHRLQQKAIIKSSDKFIAFAKKNSFTGIEKSTNYIIKPLTSYEELVRKLKSERSDYYVVTIPEGYSFYQIAEAVEKHTGLSKEKFLKLTLKDLKATNVVSSKEGVTHDLEGYLFPDTYYVLAGSTEIDVANLMLEQFIKKFNTTYEARARELGLSVNQVITVASMIEKEAINDKERKTIAGVIYNRMKKNMLLQVDATVIYGITKGEKHMEKVYYNNLKDKSSYNTYINKGLPPGPIASPGLPSIEAALYPEKHDYLYYVAAGKQHVFAKTYEEHMKNVKKYIAP